MGNATLAFITNIRWYIKEESGRQWSCVKVEASRPFTYEISSHRTDVTLHFRDAELNMPPEHLKVLDGLVSWIDASCDVAGKTNIRINLEHEVPYRVLDSFSETPPSATLYFNRDCIRQVFAGKNIVIDPGHGGKDCGKRGPVNLVEKNVALKIASRFRDDLARLGANAVLTRLDDAFLPFDERIAFTLKCNADLLISIHTAWHANRKIRGASADYLSAPGRQLAHCLCKELTNKLGSVNLGVQRSKLYSPTLRIPAVMVKPVCISNPTEEGWLRSITFIERTSLAMTNGVKSFLMPTQDAGLSNLRNSTSGGPTGDV